MVSFSITRDDKYTNRCKAQAVMHGAEAKGSMHDCVDPATILSYKFLWHCNSIPNWKWSRVYSGATWIDSGMANAVSLVVSLTCSILVLVIRTFRVYMGHTQVKQSYGWSTLVAHTEWSTNTYSGTCNERGLGGLNQLTRPILIILQGLGVANNNNIIIICHDK